MSIINKMLQELDKRNAGPGPTASRGPNAARLARQVRPVGAAAVGSNSFWRVIAGTVLVMLAWVMWVMWQSAPRSVVTDRAYQSLSQPRQSSQAQKDAKEPVPVPAPAVMVATQSALPEAAARPPEVPGAAPSLAAVRDAATIPALRFATEITAPPAGSRVREVRASTGPGMRGTGPRAGVPDAAPRTASVSQKPLSPDSDAGRIAKRVDSTPRERAESEFRRAMANVNQGRIAEGMEGLRNSLAADPAYETARQTLVALLLEANRTGDAADVLQEGLAVNPANSGFALLLARLAVERGDTQGALALMLRHAASAQQDADYRAFLGTLYQRLGRHAEAIIEYQFALGNRPGSGAWWAGLGISQEAVERSADAKESYRRARASGSLNDELASYVDRRLRQMQ